MNRGLKICLIVILLLGLFVDVGVADTVKVGYLPVVMSLPTFVAAEKGFFAQEGLKVELVPFQSGTAIIDALVAGRIDANCMSSMIGHWFAEQNVPGRFKIFLVYGTDSLTDNTFVVVVGRDSPIKDLKDLNGKRVGHFPGITQLVLARAIIRTQMDPAGVIFTELPPPNLVQALAARQIDAFFTPEPFGMLAVSKGVGRYLKKSPCTLLGLKRGILGGAFSFPTKFLEKSPGLAQKIRTSIEKAVDYIEADEKEARGFLIKYAQLPQAVALRIPFEKWIRIKDLDKNAPQLYFDLLYREGAYKTRIDTTKLYYE